jgi:predicted RNA binding protein YcfA (HicA-like mRNA interferase family)
VKAVSGRHLCKVLEKHGWKFQRIRGSHHIYARPGSPTILTVPVHGNRDLKTGTLHKLLKEAGLTENDL